MEQQNITEPNAHVSEALRKKWINYTFLGKPFKLGDGKTYMRAHSHAFEATHYYCFEDDWFWHERPPTEKKFQKEFSSHYLT